LSTILDKILESKLVEVNTLKQLVSVDAFQAQIGFLKPRVSLKNSIQEKGLGIIAEIKKRSPSKGELRPNLIVEEVAAGYTRAGAAGISILTDYDFFGGSPMDLTKGRKATSIPLLRKDFIIDEIQLYQAKAIGADVVLLIAAALSVEKLKALARKARELDLEVLLEVHSKEELEDYLTDDATLVGVNNRNLKTFDVDISLSEDLAPLIPSRFTKVTESGLKTAAEIKRLAEAGYTGFLIGESFLVSPDPEVACRKLISEIQ
jgi:indole-3-glycerol phosphate synthase